MRSKIAEANDLGRNDLTKVHKCCSSAYVKGKEAEQGASQLQKRDKILLLIFNLPQGEGKIGSNCLFPTWYTDKSEHWIPPPPSFN